MTILGLWLIQMFPNGKPTISRVIDMLKGSMKFLEIMPPQPMLSSPTRVIDMLGKSFKLYYKRVTQHIRLVLFLIILKSKWISYVLNCSYIDCMQYILLELMSH